MLQKSIFEHIEGTKPLSNILNTRKDEYLNIRNFTKAKKYIWYVNFSKKFNLSGIY